MRRVLSATISLFALATTAVTAFAADIPRAAPYRERALIAPAYNWTGPYLGINGGIGWGRSNWTGFGSGDGTGGLVGLTAGYNWQAVGSPFVFGIEGDIDWSNIRATPCGGCETRNSWLGTARGRLGYAIDRVMPYFTGGLAVGNIKTSRAGFGSTSSTEAGWTIGGGLEAAIAPNWTAKLEYLYVDLGSTACGACGVGNADFRSHVVRAGLNFRF